jgi:hypothetical protein
MKEGGEVENKEKHWYKNKEEWNKKRNELEVSDDDTNWSKDEDDNVIAKWYQEREEGWVKYKKGGVTPAKQKKIAKVMREFKEGELHIGQSDKIVKDPKQAIAIALSEAGVSEKENGGKLTGWSHKKRAGGEVGFYGVDSDTEKRAGLSRGSFKTFKNGDAFKNELKKYFLKENINKLSEGKVIIEPGNWKRLTFKSAKGFNKDNVEKIFKPIIDRFEKVFSYKLELKEFTDKSFVLEF